MSDTNYISCIVKILELPIQQSSKNNIPFTTFRVQLPQLRNSKIINLTFWGNLSRDVVEYYTINDYIIVEGYLSLRNNQKSTFEKQLSKKVEITVLRIYPFLLSYDRSNIKT